MTLEKSSAILVNNSRRGKASPWRAGKTRVIETVTGRRRIVCYASRGSLRSRDWGLREGSEGATRLDNRGFNIARTPQLPKDKWFEHTQ